MSDETKQIGNDHASNSDDKEALKGCVGRGRDEQSPPATTVHVSTSVGNIRFNLSMTVLDDVPESRPLDAQLLKSILKVIFNELRHNYATMIKGRTEEREKAKKERAARFGRVIAESLSRAVGGRAWAEEQAGEGQEEQPEAVMPDETQAEVGRRIGNIFKKETQTNE